MIKTKKSKTKVNRRKLSGCCCSGESLHEEKSYSSSYSEDEKEEEEEKAIDEGDKGEGKKLIRASSIMNMKITEKIMVESDEESYENEDWDKK